MTNTPEGQGIGDMQDATGNQNPGKTSTDQADKPALEMHNKGAIEPIDLNDEIKTSYLDYAMSVIVGRALPDIRDGLKPVHRRVIYAMYDGGYRPDRGWNKSSRVVGEVMGLYHPHGDAAIYDTLVRLAQPWVMRGPLVASQGNFGSPGNDPAAAMRYTECKMAPLAMEMVRDIDEDAVDFQPNYDNREEEPTVLPARFPNLLVNGSNGIAVGMATNIPPHNLREVNDAVQWYLKNPEATEEELLESAIQFIKGPDFPSGGFIVGRSEIEEAYRTGRGLVKMRAVVEIEEDSKGRSSLVVTELPYMCNPDNLAQKIADLVNDGRIHGISDIRDDTSSRTGQRLVIVLRKDAQPRVVLNNLYKHTQLEDTFGCNMLALVDEVPRTLRLDQFISGWVEHQISVIQRRTAFRLRKAEADAHIFRGYAAALDRLDEVIALIRSSPNSDQAREGLKELLGIDDEQAVAILNLQLRRLAALERQQILDKLAQLEATIADLKDILASDERQRQIISVELQEIVDKFGDERRTQIIPAEDGKDAEDFIPDEDMVVTITQGGYAKRTRTDAYRVQKRGGQGVRGAALRDDDEVEHLFTTSNHKWVLFFTNMGRVYRTKVWQLPEANRDAKGGHVAQLLSFQPDERIAQVLSVENYEVAKYLLLATKKGLVKKSEFALYDSPRQSGLIAINFRDEDDELIGAEVCEARDDVLLVSRKGQAIRFSADDEQLRPMGRNTSGVTGMRFKGDDELLAMQIIYHDWPEDDLFLFTVTDEGFGKRTVVSEYREQNRGGYGVRAMKLVKKRGKLAGAIVVREEDEVMSMKASGQITRSAVSEVPARGRDTMGVKFVHVNGDDELVAVTINPEADDSEDDFVDELANSDLEGQDDLGQNYMSGENNAQDDVVSPVTDESSETKQEEDRPQVDTNLSADGINGNVELDVSGSVDASISTPDEETASE